MQRISPKAGLAPGGVGRNQVGCFTLGRLNRPSPVDRFLASVCHGLETYRPTISAFHGYFMSRLPYFGSSVGGRQCFGKILENK